MYIRSIYLKSWLVVCALILTPDSDSKPHTPLAPRYAQSPRTRAYTHQTPAMLALSLLAETKEETAGIRSHLATLI